MENRMRSLHIRDALFILTLTTQKRASLMVQKANSQLYELLNFRQASLCTPDDNKFMAYNSTWEDRNACNACHHLADTIRNQKRKQLDHVTISAKMHLDLLDKDRFLLTIWPNSLNDTYNSLKVKKLRISAEYRRCTIRLTNRWGAW